jgi:tetratricopeptide (TPR) repeat protein
MKNLIIISILLITVTSGLMGQNLNSAGKAYNNAIELAQEGKIQKAIESYEKCADICAQLGEVGEGLKLQAETKICNLNLNTGIEKYKAKSYDSAIIMFTEAAKYAEIIDDAPTTTNINTYMAGALTGIGDGYYEKNKYKTAVENYNEALKYNSSFDKAYYGLTLCSIKIEDDGLLEESVNKVMEFGTDVILVNKAKLAAANYYLKLTEDAIRKDNYKIASSMASKTVLYNNADPAGYYYLALSLNEQENWSGAQRAAQVGTTIGQDDKSNIYFELGRAYAGLEDNEKACEAYGNVTDGQHKQAAIYQRTKVLKCN